MTGKGWSSLAALAAASLVASLARACPYCVGAKDAALPPTLKLVGVFLLVPFVVFMAVAVVARRLRQADDAAKPRLSSGARSQPLV